MRILIVEDEPDIRELFLAYIAPYGEGEGVVDGQEAISAFSAALDAKKPYGIVLLDIMMPRMNGCDTLRAIRKLEEESGLLLGQGAKILMTTALGDPDSILGSFRNQCDGYIIKPVTRDNLLFELRNSGLIV